MTIRCISNHNQAKYHRYSYKEIDFGIIWLQRSRFVFLTLLLAILHPPPLLAFVAKRSIFPRSILVKEGETLVPEFVPTYSRPMHGRSFRILKSTPPSRTESTTNMATASSSPLNLPAVSSTAKRIFWVRHGEVINPGGDRSVYYGAMDVQLSPLGQQEAQAAAEYLAQYRLAAVYSSNLSRAIYGAEQVRLLQQPHLQEATVIQLEDFMELDRGEWCGKTLDEIGREVMQRFDACDERVTPAGGESYRALYERVMRGKRSILSQLQPGECAAVVSHLQVTRCILSEALDSPIEHMSKLPVATASVTCIDYEYKKDTEQPTPLVHFQSYKPNVGLKASKDGAN
jgi:broad specificity phosphatase PhoE